MSDAATNAPEDWRPLLRARIFRNRVARPLRGGEDRLVLAVPLQPRWWLRGPFRALLGTRTHRELQLDRLGREIWDEAKGEPRVETVIDRFAARHQLTFHEARIALTAYLQSLVQRGVLVVAGREDD